MAGIAGRSRITRDAIMPVEKPLPEDEWLTIPTAARKLGVGVPTVRQLILDGRLTNRRVGSSYLRVLRTEVEDLALECTSARTR
jgi:excisionase family DNA binding protein